MKKPTNPAKSISLADDEVRVGVDDTQHDPTNKNKEMESALTQSSSTK